MFALKFIERQFKRQRRKFRARCLSVVIPTINSAGHIDIVLRHYKRIGVPVTVFVDSKSDDGTEEICRRYAHRVEVIDNPVGRVEAIMEDISRRVKTDWILRFDDDELPSMKMIDRCCSLVHSNHNIPYFRFRLLHCILDEDGKLSALRHFEDDFLFSRLFHRRRVKFTSEIHTPGFEYIRTLQNGVEQPDGANFLHLQWIVRSYEDRLRKITNYDAQKRNAGSGFRDYYLVEDNEKAMATAYPVHRQEFELAAVELAQRFPTAFRLGTPNFAYAIAAE